MSELLTEEEKTAIAEAIKAAEATTSGEIVFAVTDASARYPQATLQGALIGMALTTALCLLVLSEPTVTEVLWIELLSFAVVYAALPYLAWRRWLIPRREIDARVRQASLIEFYSSGLYRTRESNGILIYLSRFERHVAVLGDRGIHEKLGDPHWDDVRDTIIRGIRARKAGAGICAAVEICGKALAKHFPRRPDDTDELPDKVIERREK